MISDNGHAFDWDDEIQNDNEFTILPEGEYEFEVVKFERSRHPGSDKLPACNKAIVYLKVFGAEDLTAIVKHNIFLHSKTEGLICSFFTAIGMRKHGEPLRMDWAGAVGRRGFAKFDIRKYVNEKDGREMEINQVKSFIEPSNASGQNRRYKAGEF